jgi:hypothetical protein
MTFEEILAKTFELRAGISLSRLWLKQGEAGRSA